MTKKGDFLDCTARFEFVGETESDLRLSSPGDCGFADHIGRPASSGLCSDGLDHDVLTDELSSLELSALG
jgi:hypothetical protein